jgi:hypothetical protein
MKKILQAIVAGAMIGAFAAALAQAPAKPAAAKPAAAAPKAPSANDVAMDRAVANYKRNKGMPMEAKPAAMGAKAPAKKKM